MHSLVTAPLLVRGASLGRVDFWRADGSTPFDKEAFADAAELSEIAGQMGPSPTWPLFFPAGVAVRRNQAILG
ncbi:hypothetical protein [Actinospica sp.]|jgi:hypothetical protein|uniref:hypothetical protein n=1 Tax=Actinospica sp. TaxID=1872142 RepID=UPI002B823B7C|nr:hypothetical protein [Actinospica sp.]HWG22596.1 hypothetical protein [Actinospica sp.]